MIALNIALESGSSAFAWVIAIPAVARDTSAPNTSLKIPLVSTSVPLKAIMYSKCFLNSFVFVVVLDSLKSLNIVAENPLSVFGI